jgi:hypothetical protein
MSQTRPKPPCGPHVDVAKNDGARIARCPCGTVHVHMLRSGVSVQLDANAFGEIADAVRTAHEALDGNVRARPERSGQTEHAHDASESPRLPRGRGEFVTVQIDEVSSRKKPTLN